MWAKNLTLNHQVIINGVLQLPAFHSQDVEIQSEYTGTIDVDYIWNCADRLLWTSDLNVEFEKYDQTPNETFDQQNSFYIGSGLEYFIENNLSFSLRGHFTNRQAYLKKDRQTRQSGWRFFAGLTCYLKRS